MLLYIYKGEYITFGKRLEITLKFQKTNINIVAVEAGVNPQVFYWILKRINK